jgi:hypothetical protein
MSTVGSRTCGHSDAFGSGNICVAGCKLWLVWDEEEGVKCGLADAARDHDTPDTWQRMPSFTQFCSMQSSRWYLVTPGVSATLPANYVHCVFTLHSYFGIGFSYLTDNPVELTRQRKRLFAPSSPHLISQKAREVLGDVMRAAAVSVSPQPGNPVRIRSRRTFDCKECGLTFEWSSVLSKHMAIHTKRVEQSQMQ